MAEHYDVIIIGTGAGGGTLAYRLAPSGKRILLLERGDFLPREKQNWDVNAVFVQGRYVSKDTWYDAKGKPFQPGTHYFVGGATKLYGAALFRLRQEDFGELKHYDGISPAWPIAYENLEPYYTQAEQIYQVHGRRDVDPTDPRPARPIPLRRCRTSHAFRNCTIVWPRPTIIPRLPLPPSCSTSRTGTTASASAATPAMAFRVWCTPKAMPRSSAYARRSSTRMSPW